MGRVVERIAYFKTPKSRLVGMVIDISPPCITAPGKLTHVSRETNTVMPKGLPGKHHDGI